MHVGAGISDVEIADLAFDRQRHLREFVLAGLFPEPLRFQIAKVLRP